MKGSYSWFFFYIWMFSSYATLSDNPYMMGLFVQPDISAHVPEDKPPGETIITLNRAKECINFTITKQEPPQPSFVIGGLGGNEVLVPKDGLDAEQCQEYFVKATCSRASYVTASWFNITIGDVNEFAPIFDKPKYDGSFSPGTVYGDTIAKVNASDRDISSVLKYSIHDGSLNDTFTINHKTGDILLLKTPSNLPSYTYEFLVTASDGSHETFASVTIINHAVLECPDDRFLCALTTLCLDQESLCDGVSSCGPGDQSDEENCGNPSGGIDDTASTNGTTEMSMTTNEQTTKRPRIITASKACPADVDNYNTTWTSTAPSSYAKDQKGCPNGYTGTVYRFCDLTARWHQPVYNCTSQSLRNIKHELKTGSSDVTSVLKKLVSFTAVNTSTTKPLLVGDVQTTDEVLADIADILESNTHIEDDLVDDFLEVADNLMKDNSKSSWQSLINETRTGVDKVLHNIDRVVEKLASTSTDDEEYIKATFYVKVGRIKESQTEIAFPNRSSLNIPQWAENRADAIVLPLSEDNRRSSYSSIVYKDLRDIIPDRSTERSGYNVEEVLNSPIMSLTLFPKPREPLSKPVIIKFQLLERSLFQPKCSYWQQGKSSGWWDTDGCTLDRYDEDSSVVVCKCSHLTNFAVLMSQVPASAEHLKILSVISLVGCITSMLCLVITVAVYIKFWRRVGGERSLLLLKLCAALFLAYLVFLLGVDKVSNKDWCTGIAAFMHFLYLSVFFIMLAKSLYLAKMLLWPMNRTPIVKWCIVAAYGASALVVGVSLGVSKLQGYGTDTSCWLSTRSGLIWAFIGPALCVMGLNAVVAVIVLKIKFTTVGMANKSTKEKVSSALRSILILTPLMGLTWVFGVFSVSEQTVVFQYLFAICNSLQGLLIFIFHCLMDHKIKKQIIKSARKTMRKVRPKGNLATNTGTTSGTNTTLEMNMSPSSS